LSGRVIQMLVDHYQARDDGLAGEIEHGRVSRSLDARGVTELSDVAIADDQRLVLLRSRAGPVDDAHVRERDDGGIDLEEVADGVAELRGWGVDDRRSGTRDRHG